MRALVAAGTCIDCRRSAADVAQKCVTCWFRYAACRNAGGSKNGPTLEAIWHAQGGRCALTGVALVRGDGASVDHHVPRSRGGTHDASNLRWVTRAANVAKNNLSDDDFLALCRNVVARLGP